MKSILHYFPYETPRDVQRDVLLGIEEVWESSDVIPITVPTAGGKTSLSQTLIEWAKKEKKQRVAYLHPSNILLDQYTSEFPRTFALRNMDWYECTGYEGGERMSCGEVKRMNLCRKCMNCPYKRAMIISKSSKHLTCNYHTFMAHKLSADVLIIDEAHKLLPFFQELASKKYWYKDWEFPTWVTTYAKFLKYMREEVPLRKAQGLKSGGKVTKKLLESLEADVDNFFIKKSVEKLRGHDEWCIKATPLSVQDHTDILFRSNVKKIILMSATISVKEVEELGLAGKRTTWFHTPSPIAKERRQIIYEPIGNMGLKHWDTSVPKLIDYLQGLLDCEDSQGMKGFIHAPYSLAMKIQEHLGSHPRLMFHERDNRTDVLQSFVESDKSLGMVMVASGLEEGVDLKHDLAEWQVITKVPYMSLGEPAVVARMNKDPTWYLWQALKLLIQAAGRVCRSPDDFGTTFIVDTNFKRLYNEGIHLIPEWFKEAIEWE